MARFKQESVTIWMSKTLERLFWGSTVGDMTNSCDITDLLEHNYDVLKFSKRTPEFVRLTILWKHENPFQLEFKTQEDRDFLVSALQLAREFYTPCNLNQNLTNLCAS